MKSKFNSSLIILAALLIGTDMLYAAVGCTLKDPDRDVKRLFPKATNYKTEFFSFNDNGYPGLRKEVETKLGDTLDPVYEPNDVPYAYYTILKGTDIIGYIHGVNQKGRFGGMQLILATDTEGKILDFYFQKLTSPEAGKLRNKKFTKQFAKLSLKEFYTEDLTQKITDPTKDNRQDYLATLRGLKKNLILCDIFKLNKKYDVYFYQTQNNPKQENQS